MSGLRLPCLLGPLVLLASLSGCEPPSSSWEGVEVIPRRCGGYVDPYTRVQLAVRAQQLDPRDPKRLLLSLKLMYENEGQAPLDDPRIWPDYLDPSKPVNPAFEGIFPAVLLRVGEIDASGELSGEWTVLLPNATPPAEPRVLILDPSIELSFPWLAPKPGRYTLQVISDAYGSQAHRKTDPRCQGDVIDPVCRATSFAEFKFEVPPP